MGPAAQTPEPAQWKAEIPRVWDDAAMAALELPLADPAGSPRAISSDAYYRLPARPIFRSYPIYHPDREPDGCDADRCVPGGCEAGSVLKVGAC